MLTATKEKRLFSRVICLVDLESTLVEDGSFEVETVEATDLSLSGLGIKFEVGQFNLRLGDKVLIRIFGLAPVRAKVCWVGLDRAGLQFYDTLANVLDSWVGEVLAAQGARVDQLLRAEQTGFEGIDIGV